MSDFPVSFGEWVQQLREELDLTRNELALKVGCSPVTIKKIERDERKPSRQIAELLAIHLQLGPDLYDPFVKRARGQFVETRPGNTQDASEALPKPTVESVLPEIGELLIGRETELSQLMGFVTAQSPQLISIIGTGGIGKSHLAQALAHQVVGHFDDGVFWIDFGGHTEASHMIPALAKGLRISIKKEARSPKQQLVDWLKQKHLLIICDNFDNLIEFAELLPDLIEYGPRVKLLVTSRQRLNLQQEQIFPVEGLPYPAEAEAYRTGHFPAVELFVETARKIDPAFQLNAENLPGVVEICQLVAGMPLSLSLAAAWTDMLPPAEIAKEIKNSLDFLESNLRNIPARHKSIRAVFDASWIKLSDREQKIFARLTIFQGGFSRRAAQSVAGASLPILARLVDRSLVRYDAQNELYRLNGLLRQYGGERLEEQESSVAIEDLCERHSIYFLEALAELRDQIKGEGQIDAIEQIGRGLRNVRAAWRWAVNQLKIDLLQIALEPLGNFLEFQGRYQEGEQVFLSLYHHFKDEPSSDKRNRLMLNTVIYLSLFEFALGKVERGERSLLEAQAIIEQLNETDIDIDRERAFANVQLGQLEMTRDVNIALDKFKRALTLYEQLGMAWEQGATMMQIGTAERTLSRFDEASHWLAQSLELRQQHGDQIGAVETLATMSELVRHRGQFYDALLNAQNGVALARQINNDNVLARALSELGMACYYEGEFPKQHQALLESLAIYERLNNLSGMSRAYHRLSMSKLALGQVEMATEHAQVGLNLARQAGNQQLIALLTWSLAVASAVSGFYDSAKQMLIDSLAAFPATAVSTDKNGTLILIAWTDYHIGNPTPAKRNLATALQVAIDHRDTLSLMLQFGVSAVVFAGQGDVVQAIVMWEMLQRFSGNLQKAVWLRKIYGDRLNAVKETLSAEQLEAIEAHLQKNSLWDEAGAVQSKIAAENWDNSTRSQPSQTEPV